MKYLIYRLADEIDQPELIQTLPNGFTLVTESRQQSHLTFYDSFDWRLYGQSLALLGDGQSLFLYHLDEAVEMPRTAVANPPIFAWELPEGELQAAIAPILAARALLPQADIHLHTTLLQVQNEDEKGVAWLWLEATPPLATYARLLPVRGYEQEAEQVAEWLETVGGTAVSPANFYHQSMTAAGKLPGDYTAKTQLTFDPNMPATTAVKCLLQAELRVIQTNAPYIGKDIDTEFLHDFRVALRRTRSALGQFKQLFPADQVLRFRDELKIVAQWTNELRDLDVYLLAEDKYRALLPEMMQAEIGPLFAYLRQKRVSALATAVTRFQSAEYQTIMDDWTAFLGTAETDADQPLLPLAQHHIHKRYRRIRKEGRHILQNGDEAQMHALRIQCKKLRYLLEFFASLFPPEQLAVLITQLKSLQATLGDINDLRVQEAYLLGIARELPLESHSALLAIGALVAKLHDQRTQAKILFREAFTQFAVKENRRLFKQLFKTAET
jgi:CHAD domain-containing protein